jgi:uncharacterized protein (UPF0333 family)
MKILKYFLILVVVGAVAYFVYGKFNLGKVEYDSGSTSKTTVESNVESYLRETISVLSPVEATMGGTWYLVSVEVDEKNHSGIVVYEDGHNQERRNFTFTTDEEGGILTLKIE